jgi:hypothetical protein
MFADFEVDRVRTLLKAMDSKVVCKLVGKRRRRLLAHFAIFAGASAIKTSQQNQGALKDPYFGRY